MGEVLSPQQFAAHFKPSEYGADWSSVRAHVHNEKCCGGWMDPDENARMAESIRKTGVQTPVIVKDGFVTDGHHRVGHAMNSGTAIPYEHGYEAYEGQIEAAKRGEHLGGEDEW